jgi:hypothetical protein
MKILLTGYPKSGTTYLCRLLDCLLQDTHQISKQLSSDIKRAYRRDTQRIYFSYLNNPLYNKHQLVPAFESAVVLYRDFRDILVSCYFQQKHREHTKYAGALSEFIDFDFGGIRSIVRFYNTVEQAQPNMLAVSYETLAENVPAILSKLDEKKDNAFIQRCLAQNSFENMRKLEVQNYGTSDTAERIELAPKDLDNTDTYKTRRGKIGGYVDYLTPNDVAKINAIVQAEYANAENNRWCYADCNSKSEY